MAVRGTTTCIGLYATWPKFFRPTYIYVYTWQGGLTLSEKRINSMYFDQGNGFFVTFILLKTQT